MEEHLVVGIDMLRVVVSWVLSFSFPLSLVKNPVLAKLKGVVPALILEVLDSLHRNFLPGNHLLIELGAHLINLRNGYGEALSEHTFVADRLIQLILYDCPAPLNLKLSESIIGNELL